MPRTKIEWEPLASLLASGLVECTEQQWRESGADHADVPLSVNWALYQKMEDAAVFRVLAARRGDELVGYIALYLTTHTMYSTTTHATCDSIYAKLGHRGVGILLVRELERRLTGGYVCRIVYGAQIASEWPRVLVALGYPATETVHVKVLRPKK